MLRPPDRSPPYRRRAPGRRTGSGTRPGGQFPGAQDRPGSAQFKGSAAVGQQRPWREPGLLPAPEPYGSGHFLQGTVHDGPVLPDLFLARLPRPEDRGISAVGQHGGGRCRRWEGVSNHRCAFTAGGPGVDSGSHVRGKAHHFVPAPANALGRVPRAETRLPAPRLKQGNEQQRQCQDRQRNERDPQGAKQRPQKSHGLFFFWSASRASGEESGGRSAGSCGGGGGCSTWGLGLDLFSGSGGMGMLSLGGVGSKLTQPTRSNATSTQAWTSLPVIFTSLHRSPGWWDQDKTPSPPGRGCQDAAASATWPRRTVRRHRASAWRSAGS